MIIPFSRFKKSLLVCAAGIHCLYAAPTLADNLPSVELNLKALDRLHVQPAQIATQPSERFVLQEGLPKQYLPGTQSKPARTPVTPPTSKDMQHAKNNRMRPIPPASSDIPRENTANIIATSPLVKPIQETPPPPKKQPTETAPKTLPLQQNTEVFPWDKEPVVDTAKHSSTEVHPPLPSTQSTHDTPEQTTEKPAAHALKDKVIEETPPALKKPDAAATLAEKKAIVPEKDTQPAQKKPPLVKAPIPIIPNIAPAENEAYYLVDDKDSIKEEMAEVLQSFTDESKIGNTDLAMQNGANTNTIPALEVEDSPSERNTPASTLPEDTQPATEIPPSNEQPAKNAVSEPVILPPPPVPVVQNIELEPPAKPPELTPVVQKEKANNAKPPENIESLPSTNPQKVATSAAPTVVEQKPTPETPEENTAENVAQVKSKASEPVNALKKKEDNTIPAITTQKADAKSITPPEPEVAVRATTQEENAEEGKKVTRTAADSPKNDSNDTTTEAEVKPVVITTEAPKQPDTTPPVSEKKANEQIADTKIAEKKVTIPEPEDTGLRIETKEMPKSVAAPLKEVESKEAPTLLAQMQDNPLDDIELKQVPPPLSLAETAVTKPVDTIKETVKAVTPPQQDMPEQEMPEQELASLPAPATPAITEGALQLVYPVGETTLPANMQGALTTLAQQTAKDTNMRLEIKAYASSTDDQPTSARRMSLARALAVRAFLIDQGLDSLRINVKALGTDEGSDTPDRVDIISTPIVSGSSAG